MVHVPKHYFNHYPHQRSLRDDVLSDLDGRTGDEVVAWIAELKAEAGGDEIKFDVDYGYGYEDTHRLNILAVHTETDEERDARVEAYRQSELQRRRAMSKAKRDRTKALAAKAKLSEEEERALWLKLNKKFGAQA